MHSYKLNVVIEDATGRGKIFMFGGVAEQVVRRTAADLVEESSPNQILLPAALRAIVGRSYVFQVVISEQTFRIGQLCFQARRLFNLQVYMKAFLLMSLPVIKKQAMGHPMQLQNLPFLVKALHL